MTKVFLQIVNLSITASYLICAVLVLRLLLRRVPKNLTLWLWALVGIRLALPFSLKSALSLVPKAQPIPADIALSPAPAIDSGIPVINQAVNPVIAQSFTPAPLASANPLQLLLPILAAAWLVGMAGMVLYALIRFLGLRKQVRVSLRLRDNVYLCDHIPTPFLLGLVKPNIYLPSDMEPAYQAAVLRHEYAHLRHHDNGWKILGYGLLCVYWFHPLVWLAYVLFCRDLEMACDERAIQDMTQQERQAYSYALLACAAPGHRLSICPLAFGETGVKSRIRNVLRFRKAGIWVAALVFLIALVTALCFLTNPREEVQGPTQPGPVREEITPEATTREATTQASEAPLPTLSRVEASPDPELAALTFQDLDGDYTYENGSLTLLFHNVTKVATRTLRDRNGESYEQTILLKDFGATVELASPGPDGGQWAWRLVETSGSEAPITVSERMPRHALTNNEYDLQDLLTGRTVLLIKRAARLSADGGTLRPATAQAALALDRNTGELLYTWQPDEKVPVTIQSRLALALAVLEDQDPEELVPTDDLPDFLFAPPYYGVMAQDGSYLEAAKEMRVEDLLTVLLMWGNYQDVRYALARFDAGSEGAMVEKMNALVGQLGSHTHFTDLYGLADGQYSTARDTLLLVNRALENPCLARIWGKSQLILSLPDDEEAVTVTTTNYMLDAHILFEFYDHRVTGGISGSFSGSSDLVCTASQGDRELVGLILGAQRRTDPTKDWVVEYWGSFEEMSALLNTLLDP